MIANDIHIVVKKLRYKRGYYYPDEKKIEIDSRLQGEEQLEIYIHEYLHHLQPYLDEDEVGKVSQEMAKYLFDIGYRQTKTQ